MFPILYHWSRVYIENESFLNGYGQSMQMSEFSKEAKWSLFQFLKYIRWFFALATAKSGICYCLVWCWISWFVNFAVMSTKLIKGKWESLLFCKIQNIPWVIFSSWNSFHIFLLSEWDVSHFFKLSRTIMGCSNFRLLKIIKLWLHTINSPILFSEILLLCRGNDNIKLYIKHISILPQSIWTLS